MVPPVVGLVRIIPARWPNHSPWSSPKLCEIPYWAQEIRTRVGVGRRGKNRRLGGAPARLQRRQMLAISTPLAAPIIRTDGASCSLAGDTQPPETERPVHSPATSNAPGRSVLFTRRRYPTPRDGASCSLAGDIQRPETERHVRSVAEQDGRSVAGDNRHPEVVK